MGRLIERVRAWTARRQQPGQAIVEYALSITVLLYLLMGVVDLGRAFAMHNLLANTAREAARYGTIPGRSVAQIQSYALGKAGFPGVSVTVVDLGTSGDVTDPVVVEAGATFVPITPLIGQLCCGGGSLNLAARSSMLVER